MKKEPEITYEFVESKEAEERLNKAFDILFEAVMKSRKPDIAGLVANRTNV